MHDPTSSTESSCNCLNQTVVTGKLELTRRTGMESNANQPTVAATTKGAKFLVGLALSLVLKNLPPDPNA